MQYANEYLIYAKQIPLMTTKVSQHLISIRIFYKQSSQSQVLIITQPAHKKFCVIFTFATSSFIMTLRKCTQKKETITETSLKQHTTITGVSLHKY